MVIDVIGGAFIDIYIYKSKNNTKIIESFGGSGLNIALGLHLLGNDVSYHGNIGTDKRGYKLMSHLKSYNFPTKRIRQINGYTGLYIAENDKMKNVFRGVNDEKINTKNFGFNCGIVTTEINTDSIKGITAGDWNTLFLDIGPRPGLIKDLSFKNNCIKVGNHSENKVINCDIIKKGKHGGKWHSIRIPGDNKIYKHTIGAGDIFDTIIIDSFLKGIGREESLKKAVNIAEKACKIRGGFESKFKYLMMARYL